MRYPDYLFHLDRRPLAAVELKSLPQLKQLREALAGAIAWVADTDVALTVATSTTDRLATTLMLAVMLLALSASGVRQRMVSQMEEGS